MLFSLLSEFSCMFRFENEQALSSIYDDKLSLLHLDSLSLVIFSSSSSSCLLCWCVRTNIRWKVAKNNHLSLEKYNPLLHKFNQLIFYSTKHAIGPAAAAALFSLLNSCENISDKHTTTTMERTMNSHFTTSSQFHFSFDATTRHTQGAALGFRYNLPHTCQNAWKIAERWKSTSHQRWNFSLFTLCSLLSISLLFSHLS